MQRYTSHIKNTLEDQPQEEESNATSTDKNARVGPCGGYPKGKVFFDAEVDSKIMVAWKVLHPDSEGNCTIRLGAGESEADFRVLRPLDVKDMKGKFECGRSQSNYDGKIV